MFSPFRSDFLSKVCKYDVKVEELLLMVGVAILMLILLTVVVVVILSLVVISVAVGFAVYFTIQAHCEVSCTPCLSSTIRITYAHTCFVLL